MGLELRQGPLMKERTTLRLGGKTLAEAVICCAADCEELPRVLEREGGAPLVLGWGSNILAHDGELPYVVVNSAVKDAPVIVGEQEGSVLVSVGAGFRLPRLLGWLATKGLAGLEGLVGIPGTVGGAVAMNAGSYGCETGRCLHSVQIFSPSRGLQVLSPDDFVFEYRKFAVAGLSEWFVVLQAVFSVKKLKRDSIQATMREKYLQKKSTQPITAYSAGCVYKNPAQGVSSGKLLDEAGFRGKSFGGMAFSKMHANFLINTGDGSSEEAFTLLSEAHDRVKKISGYDLTLEVRVI